ncbi:MAG: Rne/Rng family ribonuclease [Elusimicrobia bacterium]|nr:Rne/Rng family ribonuclease [Elusimicrobiota bacterium]
MDPNDKDVEKQSAEAPAAAAPERAADPAPERKAEPSPEHFEDEGRDEGADEDAGGDDSEGDGAYEDDAAGGGSSAEDDGDDEDGRETSGSEQEQGHEPAGGDEPASGQPPAAPAQGGQPDQPGQQPGQGGGRQQESGRPHRHGQRRRRGRGGRGGGAQGQQGGGRGQGGGQHAHQHPQGRQGQGHGGEHRGGRQDNGSDRRGGSHPDQGGSSVRVPAVRKPVKREILSSANFEETRIAILEDGRIAELLWERRSAESIVGNIYKGVIENVLPGISSAFVNIGFEKNAYLYISDVLGGRGTPIDQLLKKGQEVVVQVCKEAISTKGAKVTMDVSLPGRFLVFMPYQKYVGISKNIQDPSERERLAGIMDKLVADHLGGRGLVVRTEAEGATAKDLELEVKYLVTTWNAIQAKHDAQAAPALLHEDLDLNLQVARDILSEDVYVYLIDSKEGCKNVLEFVNGFAPDLAGKVRLYENKTPIFKAFDIESEIERLRDTKVSLPNGGSIIIQEAESLCAIDVNTGRFTGSKSQEETVTQTNIEAAVEIAHQLRLRNIGGIVVVDFIDMRKASNRNKVMEAFAAAVKRDRAKIRILPITRLGLIEMTRERKRESTLSLITDECPQCKGTGHVLSAETLRIRIQREVREMTAGRPGGQIRLVLHPGLADVMRTMQAKMEKNVQRSVKIQGDPQLHWDDYRIILE